MQFLKNIIQKTLSLIFKQNKDQVSTSVELWCPFATILPEPKLFGVPYVKGYPMGAVVHFTAGRSLSGLSDAKSTLAYLNKNGHNCFVISSEGDILQNFPLSKSFSHAGESYWPTLGHSLSSKLVGIEVCCAGPVSEINGNYKSWFGELYGPDQVRTVKDQDNVKAGTFHKFTSKQEIALLNLLLWLYKNNPNVFSLDNVLGHDEIAPNRKQDPGGSLSTPMPNFRDKLKAKAKS